MTTTTGLFGRPPRPRPEDRPPQELRPILSLSEKKDLKSLSLSVVYLEPSRTPDFLGRDAPEPELSVALRDDAGFAAVAAAALRAQELGDDRLLRASDFNCHEESSCAIAEQGIHDQDYRRGGVAAGRS